MHPIVSRRQAAGGQKLRLLQIGADYSLAALRASTNAIAAVTGTTRSAVP
jgi:hypothetical protein